MKTYSINEQILSFDCVLPWEGQPEPVCWKGDRCFLQLSAPNASAVTCRMNEQEYAFTKDPDGIWRFEYPFREGMQYIQFLVDGMEILSPLFPVSFGYSRPYNYVAIERTDENFYRIQDVPHGSVRREYFFSSVNESWESCMVYTPACYETEPDRIFPVLYLQHGHGENETSWITSGKANFILDNLIAEGKAEPFLVVMCNGMVQTAGKNGKRLVDFRLFEKQLPDDIISFIETRFRTGGTKKSRAMAGLSMGSLQTSIIAFTHPELFDSAGIFSGFVSDFITGSPLDPAHDEAGDNRHLVILEDSKKFQETFRIFFRAIGSEDPFMEHFIHDDQMLAEKQIPQIRKIYPGGHDWNVWRKCFRDFAQLIFRSNTPAAVCGA